MKQFFGFVVVGALLGGTLTTWFAPGAIAWYFNPPESSPLPCKDLIEWALLKLRLAQLWGALAGAGVGLIAYLSYFWGKVRRRKPTSFPEGPMKPRI